MRKVIDWIMLLAVLGGGGYWAYQHPAQMRYLVRMVQSQVAPCSAAITYSLGTIDPRFHISKNEMMDNLKEAEAIWEEPSDKDLFRYVEEGGEVVVDLVYDERQAATDKLQTLGYKIDESKSTYDSLRARYDALSTQVEVAQPEYKTQVAAFDRRQAIYEAEVKRWNREGGAPADVYARLENEKAALQAQVASIKRAERELNADIDTLNALATTLNQLIVHLNLNVDQYNRTGAREGEFEEGLYEVENGVTTITIYEFSNATKLVRVLAHEMGHALGLDHVADEQAIMYEINKGTARAATEADREELNRVCRIKSA